MGGFHVVVEVTSRDIVRLLHRARVNEETVNDVKGHLAKLMSASYNEVEMRKAAPVVPAEDICASICMDIVDEVCNVRIPALQAVQLERENSKWMHRYAQERHLRRTYEMELTYKSGRMDRMEDAQKMLMTSYFKEARLLRQQLETQAERHEKTLSAAGVSSSSMRRKQARIPTFRQVAQQVVNSRRSSMADGADQSPSLTPPQTAITPPQHIRRGSVSLNISGDEPNTAFTLSDAQFTTSQLDSTTGTMGATVRVFNDGRQVPTTNPFGTSSNITTTPGILVSSRDTSPTAAASPSPQDVYCEGLTGNAIFDYEKYLSLIDNEMASWPAKYKEKEDEIEAILAQHNTETIATAARHRAEILEKEMAIKSRDDYLKQLTGHAENLAPAVKEVVKKAKSDMKAELDEMKIACTDYNQEVQKALKMLHQHTVDIDARMEVFVKFVSHCTKLLQENATRIINGKRVNAMRGPPLWHFFLLKGEDDPDQESKLFWQQSTLVKGILSNYKDIVMKMEDISKIKEPSVYDRLESGNSSGGSRRGSRRRRKTRVAGENFWEEFNGAEPSESSESEEFGSEDEEDGPADDGQLSEYSHPSTAPPSRTHHRKLGPFTDNDAATPKWMAKSDKGFKPPKRTHDKFMSPRTEPRKRPGDKPVGIADVVRPSTRAHHAPSAPRPGGKVNTARRPTENAPHKPSGRADSIASSGPRKSVAQGPLATGGNNGTSSRASRKSVGAGDLRRERERLGMTPADEQLVRKLSDQRRRFTATTVRHIYRRLTQAAKRRVFFKKLPQDMKNVISTLQHLDDDIMAETTEVDKTRKRIDHLTHNIGAIREGQQPVSWNSYLRTPPATTLGNGPTSGGGSRGSIAAPTIQQPRPSLVLGAHPTLTSPSNDSPSGAPPPAPTTLSASEGTQSQLQSTNDVLSGGNGDQQRSSFDVNDNDSIDKKNTSVLKSPGSALLHAGHNTNRRASVNSLASTASVSTTIAKGNTQPLQHGSSAQLPGAMEAPSADPAGLSTPQNMSFIPATPTITPPPGTELAGGPFYDAQGNTILLTNTGQVFFQQSTNASPMQGTTPISSPLFSGGQPHPMGGFIHDRDGHVVTIQMLGGAPFVQQQGYMTLSGRVKTPPPDQVAVENSPAAAIAAPRPKGRIPVPGGGEKPRQERVPTTEEGYMRTAALHNMSEQVLEDEGPAGFAGQDTDLDLLRIKSLEQAPRVYVPKVGSGPSRDVQERSRELLLNRADDGPFSPPQRPGTYSPPRSREGGLRPAPPSPSSQGQQQHLQGTSFTSPRHSHYAGGVGASGATPKLPPL